MIPPGQPGAEPGEQFLVMLLEGSSAERPPFPGAPEGGSARA